MDDLNTLVSRVKKISSLPDIFIKINNLANDPTSSANDLAKVIESDQALTTRLLQLANSAFYGFPGKITSVSKGITIIGFKQLKELVLAASVRNRYNGFDNSLINMKSFWEHSIACGITARILAIYSGIKQPDSYFIAGFLHDLGRLVLLEQYPVKYTEVIKKAREEERLLYNVEQEVFGFSHAEVGGLLINYWQLPEMIGDAVRCHHNPNVETANASLSNITHIANIITHACCIGFSGDYFVPPLFKAAWSNSNLNTSMLEPAFKKISELYADMITFLTGGVE